MNKYLITNPNNKEVRECKSRTTGQDAQILNRGMDIKTDIINRGGNFVNEKKKK